MLNEYLPFLSVIPLPSTHAKQFLYICPFIFDLLPLFLCSRDRFESVHVAVANSGCVHRLAGLPQRRDEKEDASHHWINGHCPKYHNPRRSTDAHNTWINTGQGLIDIGLKFSSFPRGGQREARGSFPWF